MFFPEAFRDDDDGRTDGRTTRTTDDGRRTDGQTDDDDGRTTTDGRLFKNDFNTI